MTGRDDLGDNLGNGHADDGQSFEDLQRQWQEDNDRVDAEAEAKARAQREADEEGGPLLSRAPFGTDEALALEFAARHADKLRYVALWSQWFAWTGTHWKLDSTLHAFDRARAICREFAAMCNKPKIAAALASAKTVAAIEKLSRADRRIAATVEQWDADPWLLNTPGGIIDLRSGERRDCRAADHCTHITAVTPGGPCPQFLAFIATITGGDMALQDYLQRCLGYCLTGSTSEHALFFGYGTGANGKSVLVKTIAGLMGSYHRTAPIETFTVSKNDRHPTELAMLRGARLVTATETEEGRRWAESRIKQLTGGDKIPARFMHQNFFEFTPAFKLLITGNHKPSLRSVDEAIRRRLHLWPFAVTIPEPDRDPDLADRLEHEWPGILAWLIDGCGDWQERGLAPPQAVTEATERYLESEDAVSAWIEECCQPKAGAWASSGELFSSWETWAKLAGEHIGSRKRLAQQLETRGIEPSRTKTARGFLGLMIKPNGIV
jgi:putative DNA primase/helicase